jgi:hypothetical protein
MRNAVKTFFFHRGDGVLMAREADGHTRIATVQESAENSISKPRRWGRRRTRRR